MLQPKKYNYYGTDVERRVVRTPEEALELYNDPNALYDVTVLPQKPVLLSYQDYSLPTSLEDAYRRSVAAQVGGLQDLARQSGEYARSLAGSAMVTMAPTALIKMLTGTNVTNDKAAELSRMAMNQAQRAQQLREQAMLQGRVLPSQMDIELETQKAAIDQQNVEGRRATDQFNIGQTNQYQTNLTNAVNQIGADTRNIIKSEHDYLTSEREQARKDEETSIKRFEAETDRAYKTGLLNKALQEANAKALNAGATSPLGKSAVGLQGIITQINERLRSGRDMGQELKEGRTVWNLITGRGREGREQLVSAIAKNSEEVGKLANKLISEYSEYDTQMRLWLAQERQNAPKDPEEAAEYLGRIREQEAALDRQAAEVRRLVGRLDMLAANPDEETFKRVMTDLEMIGAGFGVQPAQPQQELEPFDYVEQERKARGGSLTGTRTTDAAPAPQAAKGAVTIERTDLLSPSRLSEKIDSLGSADPNMLFTLRGEQGALNINELREEMRNTRRWILGAVELLTDEGFTDFDSITPETKVTSSVKLKNIADDRPYEVTVNVDGRKIQQRVETREEAEELARDITNSVENLKEFKGAGGRVRRVVPTPVGNALSMSVKNVIEGEGEGMYAPEPFDYWGNEPVPINTNIIRTSGNYAIIFPE